MLQYGYSQLEPLLATAGTSYQPHCNFYAQVTNVDLRGILVAPRGS